MKDTKLAKYLFQTQYHKFGFFPTEDISFLSTELFACVRLCVPVMRINQVFRKLPGGPDYS